MGEYKEMNLFIFALGVALVITAIVSLVLIRRVPEETKDNLFFYGLFALAGGGAIIIGVI